jgi:hypothetical protein
MALDATLRMGLKKVSNRLGFFCCDKRLFVEEKDLGSDAAETGDVRPEFELFTPITFNPFR